VPTYAPAFEPRLTPPRLTPTLPKPSAGLTAVKGGGWGRGLLGAIGSGLATLGRAVFGKKED
jgi:hypothetical protein